eukprot:RCo007200
MDSTLGGGARPSDSQDDLAAEKDGEGFSDSRSSVLVGLTALELEAALRKSEEEIQQHKAARDSLSEELEAAAIKSEVDAQRHKEAQNVLLAQLETVLMQAEEEAQQYKVARDLLTAKQKAALAKIDEEAQEQKAARDLLSAELEAALLTAEVEAEKWQCVEAFLLEKLSDTMREVEKLNQRCGEAESMTEKLKVALEKAEKDASDFKAARDALSVELEAAVKQTLEEVEQHRVTRDMLSAKLEASLMKAEEEARQYKVSRDELLVEWEAAMVKAGEEILQLKAVRDLLSAELESTLLTAEVEAEKWQSVEAFLVEKLSDAMREVEKLNRCCGEADLASEDLKAALEKAEKDASDCKAARDALSTKLEAAVKMSEEEMRKHRAAQDSLSAELEAASVSAEVEAEKRKSVEAMFMERLSSALCDVDKQKAHLAEAQLLMSAEVESMQRKLSEEVEKHRAAETILQTKLEALSIASAEQALRSEEASQEALSAVIEAAAKKAQEDALQHKAVQDTLSAKLEAALKIAGSSTPVTDTRKPETHSSSCSNCKLVTSELERTKAELENVLFERKDNDTCRSRDLADIAALRKALETAHSHNAAISAELQNLQAASSQLKPLREELDSVKEECAAASAAQEAAVTELKQSQAKAVAQEAQLKEQATVTEGLAQQISSLQLAVASVESEKGLLAEQIAALKSAAQPNPPKKVRDVAVGDDHASASDEEKEPGIGIKRGTPSSQGASKIHQGEQRDTIAALEKLMLENNELKAAQVSQKQEIAGLKELLQVQAQAFRSCEFEKDNAIGKLSNDLRFLKEVVEARRLAEEGRKTGMKSPGSGGVGEAVQSAPGPMEAAHVQLARKDGEVQALRCLLEKEREMFGKKLSEIERQKQEGAHMAFSLTEKTALEARCSRLENELKGVREAQRAEQASLQAVRCELATAHACRHPRTGCDQKTHCLESALRQNCLLRKEVDELKARDVALEKEKTKSAFLRLEIADLETQLRAALSGPISHPCKSPHGELMQLSVSNGNTDVGPVLNARYAICPPVQERFSCEAKQPSKSPALFHVQTSFVSGLPSARRACSEALSPERSQKEERREKEVGRLSRSLHSPFREVGKARPAATVHYRSSAPTEIPPMPSSAAVQDIFSSSRSCVGSRPK